MELTGGRTTIKLRRSGQVVLLSGAARRRSLSKGALHSQRNFQQGVFITHRRRRIEVTAGSSENAFSDGLVVFVEHSQQTLRSLYLKALPGPLGWAPSYLVPAATGLSIYGSANGHRLLQFLSTLQAPDWFPMSQSLSMQYALHSRLIDTAFDTALATVAALLVFLGLPAMDMILGTDSRTPAQVQGRDVVFKSILYSHVVFYWLLVASACCTASEAQLHPLTALGLMLSVGCSGAMNFVVSHELLHSPAKGDKRVASLALMPVAYSHWVASHLAHHRKVGKMEDPTTARLGEPLYRFIPRSVWGNIVDGWQAEQQRLHSWQLPFYSHQNRLFHWVAGPTLLLAAVYTMWGERGALLGIGQALAAIIMLEDVNYIEHYGLKRRQLAASDKFEKISVFHSWNANWLFTNSIIFSLQRHSDHHENAHKPYQMLENIPEAPQLPASYPAMMLLSLFPGIFFDVMDPRVMQTASKRADKALLE